MTQNGAIVPATGENIAFAARLITEGKLVAFPTETVYGLGADATDDRAVATVFAAKKRPNFNPLIVHFADAEAAASAVKFDDRAMKLAGAMWPGALTMILFRHKEGKVSLLAGAGQDRLAVRVPGDRTALALLRAAGRPLTSPSANRSGDVSPTTAAHVAESLGGAVDLILDGGPCRVGIESTIVDLTEESPLIMRPGAISARDIEAVIGPLYSACNVPCVGPSAPGRASGGRQYATRLPLRLDAGEVKCGEALLAFGSEAIKGEAERVLNLSPSGDLTEAAANLFAMLHDLDNPAFHAIAVMPIPEDGLGRAINDRLRRATAGP
ncbi:MAG: threonylcarbamoyl-AMP synthase [Rhodospirillales bacterium RIFCSPLOWO2_12_FULL_58_28]|nr:MAG: threonylcarbamoyl-AMP synthase [Rhodospirillales bacterium RIFCSPLOWO2_02_FULL_58_16]OHC79914.1 MAG: threonylcarbamoyl-AMP synthase [Rhodospirillales bacterium RIFCSPLOWO2_12_FULL_58_28]